MDITAYIESGMIETCLLGMANEQELAEYKQLYAQYPEVKKAADSFEASLKKAAFDNTVSPSSSIKEKLFEQLKGEFAKEEDKDVAPVVFLPKTNNATSKNWIQYAAAAAVILFVASSALNVYFYQKFTNANEKFIALLNQNNTIVANNSVYQTQMLDMHNSMQMMTDPAMLKVTLGGIPGKENSLATLFWDTKTKDVYILPNKLAPTPENKQYQLWAIVDGKPVDAGMLQDDCTGLCKLKNIPSASAFAITLENKGGSPVPTMDAMIVLGKVS